MLSGFSALVYQIAWQRKLYSIFGISSEASAVIITVFMIGLGSGALLGGWLSRRNENSLLRTFAIIEISIGLYAFTSIGILSFLTTTMSVASKGLMYSSISIFLITPAILMGASLPVLIQYLRKNESLSLSVDILYSANSLGAAIAGFATILILFKFFSLTGTVITAGIINIIAGSSGYFLQYKTA